MGSAKVHCHGRSAPHPIGKVSCTYGEYAPSWEMLWETSSTDTWFLCCIITESIRFIGAEYGSSSLQKVTINIEYLQQ